MYMNKIQLYIASLLREYGPLLKRQLVCLVNLQFASNFSHLDKYIAQMCSFAAYMEWEEAGERYVGEKGTAANYDVIRALEVMLSFGESVLEHHKCEKVATVRFCAQAEHGVKFLSVIPVRCGQEQSASIWVHDTVSGKGNEIIIFLLENVEQMRCFPIKRSCRYAVLDSTGKVMFFKQ